MHPKSKRSHFNIMVSSLVTSKGRCIKSTVCLASSPAGEKRAETNPNILRWLAAATEREAAKQSSWEYIHLLFPNQLLQ